MTAHDLKKAGTPPGSNHGGDKEKPDLSQALTEQRSATETVVSVPPDRPPSCLLPPLEPPHSGMLHVVRDGATDVHPVDHNITGVVELPVETAASSATIGWHPEPPLRPPRSEPSYNGFDHDRSYDSTSEIDEDMIPEYNRDIDISQTWDRYRRTPTPLS